jgi:hypothetical protein
LDEGEWSVARSGRFISQENPPVRTKEKSALAKKAVWLFWSIEKSLGPAGNRTLAVQPVARLYTD